MSFELKDVLKENGIKSDVETVLFAQGRTPVYGIRKAQVKAIHTWEHLRNRQNTTHHWPVILGTDNDVEHHREFYSEAQPARDLPAAWFSYRRSADFWPEQRKPILEAYEEKGMDIPPFLTQPGKAIMREKPGEAPAEYCARDQFVAHRNDDPESDVLIALLPITKTWESAQFLQFGNWNSCPRPEVHAAVHREWNERYGAELMTMTHDTIEMRVTKPSTTWKDAFELAEDQMLYAEFDQLPGLESTRELAATLFSAPVWYFWWD